MKKDNREGKQGRPYCQQDVSAAPSLDEERRELARLIGELLAGQWLQERSGRERQIPDGPVPS